MIPLITPHLLLAMYVTLGPVIPLRVVPVVTEPPRYIIILPVPPGLVPYHEYLRESELQKKL